MVFYEQAALIGGFLLPLECQSLFSQKSLILIDFIHFTVITFDIIIVDIEGEIINACKFNTTKNLD